MGKGQEGDEGGEAEVASEGPLGGWEEQSRGARLLADHLRGTGGAASGG